MTATFDSAGPAALWVASTSSPFTWTHANTGNGILIGVVTGNGSSNLVTGVHYGPTGTSSDTSIPFLGFIASNNGTAGGIALYGLVGSAVPTGSNTVSVTWSGSISPGSMFGGSISVANAGGLGTPVTAAGSSAAMSVTVSSTTPGGLVVSFGCMGHNGTYTATSPNVLRINSGANGDNNTGADNIYGGTDPSTGGSVTPAYTASAADFWGLIAVEVLPLWSVRQSVSKSTATLTATTPAFGTPLISGSKLIAYTSSTLGMNASSVHDSNGNAFTAVDSFTTANQETHIWVLDTPAGDVGTTPTVTATWTGTANGSAIVVQEVTGLLAGTSCLDGTAGHSSANGANLTVAGSSVALGAYSSAAAGELLVILWADSGDTIGSTGTTPSGYTADASNISSDSNDDVRVYYKDSTGGSESPANITVAGGNNIFDYATAFVAFKLAGAAGYTGTDGKLGTQAVPGLAQPGAFIPGQTEPSVTSVTHNGTVSMSGSGSLTPAGHTVRVGAANLSGSGSLTDTGHTVRAGAALLSGSGSMTPTGAVVLPGAANLSGSGSMSLSPHVARVGAVTMSGSGSMSPAGQTVRVGAASLSGSGSLTATGHTVRAGAANLSGSGSMTAAGHKAVPGAALLTGSGSMSATGTITGLHLGAANLSGSGSMSLSPSVTRIGAATLAGSGSMSATGAKTETGTVLMSGSGSLTATGHKLIPGAALLSGSGSLTAAGAIQGVHPGAANLSGSGSMTAAGFKTAPGTALLTGSGTMTTGWVVAKHAAAALSGSGSMTSVALRTIRPVAMMSGSGSMTVQRGVRLEEALLGGSVTARAPFGGQISDTDRYAGQILPAWSYNGAVTAPEPYGGQAGAAAPYGGSVT